MPNCQFVVGPVLFNLQDGRFDDRWMLAGMLGCPHQITDACAATASSLGIVGIRCSPYVCPDVSFDMLCRC